MAYIFDDDPQKVGSQIGSFTIRSTAELVETVKNEGIKVAMIAVPAAHAQAVADRLVEAGIQAILNYAPISLNVPAGVYVQYIDPVIHLQRMTYYL